MFFGDEVRRRLVSLLKPWIVEEPELELKLGVLRSTVTAKNLRFDISALNQLLDEPTRFSFNDVFVDYFSVGFSNLSVPAFTIEVRGIRVTVSVGELKGEVGESSDRDSEDMKRTLSAIDPEGSALHDILEKIAATSTTTRNRLTVSFLNLILKHCQLKIHDISVLVELPVLNDFAALLLEMKELNVISQYFGGGCLLGGLVGALILPLRKSSFIINGSGFKIGLKRKDEPIHVLFSGDVISNIKLSDLRLVNFKICVPELIFSLSPADLSIILAFGKISSKESMRARTGRQLWKLAATKVSHVILTPRLSLHKLVLTTCLWLRYVNSYEYVLYIFGYSAGHLLERSAVKMSRDRVFLNVVQHHMKVIYDAEKELPAEAVAQARRIARYKASMNVQHTKDSYMESFDSPQFFRKMLLLPAFVWRVICIVFSSISQLFFLIKFWAKKSKVDGHSGFVSEDLHPQYHFSLNVGKTFVTIFPVNAVQLSDDNKIESDFGVSFADLLSFCLSIDDLVLTYTDDIYEQSVFLSCGKLQIDSLSFKESPVRESSSEFFFSPASAKGHINGRVHNSKTMLWGEPAEMFFLSESGPTNSTDNAVCDPYLKNILRETCVSWKKACLNAAENEMGYSENPCFLCEMRNFLISPGLKSPNYGFWKCSLTLGKLNLSLGYMSLLSMLVLLRQIQHALYITEDKGRTISHSPRIEDSSKVSWDGLYKFYSNKMRFAMLRLLPEKHIQLGVLIAGPRIRMSLIKEGILTVDRNVKHLGIQEDIGLSFNIHTIEIAISPTSKTDVASFSGLAGSDARPEWLILNELQIVDIPITKNENYVSHGWISLHCYLRFNGLSAYFDNSEENQQSQILILEPTTFQFSSIREYLHSFSTTVIAFSAALCGVATRLTVLSYIDELSFFFQMILGLFSAVTHAFSDFDVPLQAFLRQDMGFPEPENEERITKGAPLIYSKTLSTINVNFKLKAVDIICHSSRMNNNLGISRTLQALSSKRLADQRLPDCGIWISILKICAEISCEECKLAILTDFSGIQCVTFTDQNEMGESTSLSEFRPLLHLSLNCLNELSLSNLRLSLCLDPVEDASSSESPNNTSGCSTSGDNTSRVVGNPLTTNPESSSVQSSSTAQDILSSNIPTLSSGQWLLINVSLSEIFLARSSIKHALVGAHQLNELLISLSVGREFQSISCGIQGGFLFLETTALAMVVRCLVSYLQFVRNLMSAAQSSDKRIERVERDEDMIRYDDHFINKLAQETPCSPGLAQWELLEALTMDLSQICLIVVVEEESGDFREFVLGADAHLNLELSNMRRKFLFELSRLSIFSHVLHGTVENEIQSPHFSSVISIDSSSQSVAVNSAVAHPNWDGIDSVDDANHSIDPVSQKSEVFFLGHQNYILEHLGALVTVEKHVLSSENGPLCLNEVWAGSGSVSGVEVTLSLADIQMIMSSIASFSGLFSETTASELKQRHQLSNQERDSNLEPMIPDGTIVALKDVIQHMYLAVEGGENKHCIGGAVHYSLVGERALFKVMYQKQRRWKLPVPWFSLISVHAKNSSGEPLRLNSLPGSGFVDISSTNDHACALWKAISCEPKVYQGDIDWVPHNQFSKNTFYLVNKKNDCAVAFVDGVPEFVRKPGNAFKLKMFHGISVDRSVEMLDRCPGEASGAKPQQEAHMDEEGTSGVRGNLPLIDIIIDKVSITIVHELHDTKDTYPLLRSCINSSWLLVQILSTKTRVIGTSKAVFYYFDGQKSLWRELVHPVEICIFYRYSFQNQGSEVAVNGVPVHFFCRTKELNISLTELSLDILLYVIGKLKFAGPFSVKSSKILANCCKVENYSGLNLSCHFYNKKSVTIARRQSASILLRNSASENQPPEGVSFVSIQLSLLGSFSTSSIELFRLKAGSFAWRTRIISLKDSRTYPGPFVVVDISRKTEDGLSILVSPLIRIHNETGFTMELRFRRPQEQEDEFASVLLKTGDTIDDSMAMFDAINLSGGLKKALTSFSIGNFLLSFRPEITDSPINTKKSLSVDWSDDLKGGKAVCLSGIFDKLSYRVRKALSVESAKCSFSTSHCSLKSEDVNVGNIHFLIESIGRNVPVKQPDKPGDGTESRNLPVALQEQKEIFLLPTVRVSNLLHSEIHVVLTETLCTTVSYDNIGKEATIASGSTADFYANPALIYFTVTLTAFNSSCKSVNSGDWVKKFHKQTNAIHFLDIDLDFGGGKYFASLRLSRGQRGILEAAVFTSYALKNDTDFSLVCFVRNKKAHARDEAGNLGSSIPPELGLFLPPKSIRSWFVRSNKVLLKLLENNAHEAQLDLDAISGLAEISLEVEEEFGVKYMTKFGVSTGPCLSKVAVSSQTVTIVPRYIVINESEESITIRQCYLEDDTTGFIQINSKQRTILQLRDGISKNREFSLFENYIKNHRSASDDSLTFIKFQPNKSELGWSGPVCIASLGRFFLKFRNQQPNQLTSPDKGIIEFAAVHVVEEGSTFALHFYKPPNVSLPYRIENCLKDVSITFYQKDSSEPEVLGSECVVDYVWDDLTLPHKLVVRINNMHLLREIKLDKVRLWKPFFNVRQNRGLSSHLHLDKTPGYQRAKFGELNSDMVEVGYEVYADGPTRVLRVCKFSDRCKGDSVIHSSLKIELRVPQFAIHLLELGRQDAEENERPIYTPIMVARLGNINLDSIFADRQKYNQINVQSLNVDLKWVGAPFAAMLRRHQLDYSELNDCTLKIVLILLSNSAKVTQVRYASIVLQPVDLNLDEETLMRIVPFWRSSLSDSDTQSRQFYFDHFEIHPIKIIATFLPGDSYSSYSSAQETLRSFLHSVVKVPTIKSKVIELNGVLVTHALITMRELLIRCAQHYSLHAMRAICIAKGSPYLPPFWASVFDDLSSSSLDVYFDPSRLLVDLPGITQGTFKLISKCIAGNGFSGTKRYFGDLGKTVALRLRTAGSNVLFATVTEISDSVLKGAEIKGFNGMVSGFHQGILKLAMQPSLLGSALMEGGPDRKIKLDRSPGVDELYIEGYLQAMLDTNFKQEYLRVRVIDDQVLLKNLPPNSSLIDEIMERVNGFLVSQALLKGDPSTTSRPLRHLRGESDWKIGPTVLTLCEHLFVSFAIRMLRKQASKFITRIKWKNEKEGETVNSIVPISDTETQQKAWFTWKWGVSKFLLSSILAYIDGRLCRSIRNPVVRRIISGFLLSFLDKNDDQ